jgi:hypothetical protein
MSFLLCLVVYTASWIFYSKYQFAELYAVNSVESNEANKMWHLWKAVNQVSFLALGFIYEGWKLGLLSLVLYWIVFDIGVNVIALKQKWNYVGRTSAIDKFFGTWGFALKAVLLIASAGFYVF